MPCRGGSYDPFRGEQIEAGVKFQPTGQNHMVSLALVDGVFAWESINWRYAVNVSNLEDKTCYSTCLGRGDCWIGARRNIIASAAYRW